MKFILLNIILIGSANCVQSTAKPTSGLYIVRTVNVSQCTTTMKNAEKKPTVYSNFEVYYSSKRNMNLMRGNITIMKNRNNLRAFFRGYVLEDGKWHLNIRISNVNCHAFFLGLMLKFMGVKIDKRNCNVLKGTYVFENFDYNVVDHLWMRHREYGITLWRLEVVSPIGTVLCWQTVNDVIPASPNQ